MIGLMKGIYDIADNRVHISGYSVEDLAEQFGTPFYIYSEDSLRERLNILQDSFKGFDIFYSFKTNPNPDICRYIKRSGYFADTASIGELRLAVKCGFEKNEIIYSSPGKTKNDIKEAMDKCIIIADSLNELSLIDEICSEKGRKCDIGIRINPLFSLGENKAFEVMSGVPGKFGIDQEALIENIDIIKKYKNINIIGIQIYMGSQITDYKEIYNNFLNIFKVAGICAEELGFKLQFIDFGGGFGIQHTQDEPELDINKAGEMVQELKNSSEFERFKNTRLIIESGRFISGPSGVYVSKAVDIKTSRGKKYAILDGGMNTFFRPVFIKENRYPAVSVKKTLDKNLQKITLGGIMCTPIDIFEEDVMLPEIEKGDLILFSNTGAYGYTMSLTKFISHEGAKEIYISSDGKINLSK
jgi:diaminopimelate decarboxylase